MLESLALLLGLQLVGEVLVQLIFTGICGAMLAPGLLRRLRMDAETSGLAMGVASHGIGTARAFQLGEREGAFAGLAMGLNALLTAVLVPLLLGWWG